MLARLMLSLHPPGRRLMSVSAQPWLTGHVSRSRI